MSRSNMWQICHKNNLGNKLLTGNIVQAIREQELTSKQVASDIVVPTERVRNWFYKNTGMTALDLLLLMREYKFIRQFVAALFGEYQHAEGHNQTADIYIGEED
ncbi:MAG: hypothetical protein PHN64_05715 [Desulfovibrionaceae bacterium]|nr:hypothetical protein [Desulfovibrionaceae bacterium]